jgi:hypothetical protein
MTFFYLWYLCGVIGSLLALTVTVQQDRVPPSHLVPHVGFALLWALLGPIALVLGSMRMLDWLGGDPDA